MASRDSMAQPTAVLRLRMDSGEAQGRLGPRAGSQGSRGETGLGTSAGPRNRAPTRKRAATHDHTLHGQASTALECDGGRRDGRPAWAASPAPRPPQGPASRRSPFSSGLTEIPGQPPRGPCPGRRPSVSTGPHALLGSGQHRVSSSPSHPGLGRQGQTTGKRGRQEPHGENFQMWSPNRLPCVSAPPPSPGGQGLVGKQGKSN